MPPKGWLTPLLKLLAYGEPAVFDHLASRAAMLYKHMSIQPSPVLLGDLQLVDHDLQVFY